VRFLRNIQRLLAEGVFVATYKFALIHALADLAVLNGDDTGAPLEISTKDIAAKLIELYWPQARPFQLGGEPGSLILRQSTGSHQAAIVSHIAASHERAAGSLFRLRQLAPSDWKSLVNKVDRVVREMPLWKLQTMGEERLEFLYPNSDHGDRITLNPGVAYCLRAFYVLIRNLTEAAWVRCVQKINAESLGNLTDLETFLFGQQRTSLEAYRPILSDVQKGVCLYCQKALSSDSPVDHFIPWSRYPSDVGHNLVLAHKSCNSDKSDFLAAENHLSAWVERNNVYQDELHERFVESALPCDPVGIAQIAKWVYRQTESMNGQVWVVDNVLRPLGPEWAKCFAA
jgi:5-methylcytosine-specific restriction endonuclease McrA